MCHTMTHEVHGYASTTTATIAAAASKSVTGPALGLHRSTTAEMCVAVQLPKITHSAPVTPNCSWGPPHLLYLGRIVVHMHHALRPSTYDRSVLPGPCVLCCIRESTLALHATFCMRYVAGMLSASLVQLSLPTHTLSMLRQPNPTPQQAHCPASCIALPLLHYRLPQHMPRLWVGGLVAVAEAY